MPGQESVSLYEFWLAMRDGFDPIRLTRFHDIFNDIFRDTPAAPQNSGQTQPCDAPIPTAPQAPGRSGGARPARRRGRRKGSGSLERQDAPLLVKMKRFLDSGEAVSVREAAKLVVKEASGVGSEESKRTRLEKRFRKENPDY
jgi:hypothetical protein